jgi:hypothetical protein
MKLQLPLFLPFVRELMLVLSCHNARGCHHYTDENYRMFGDLPILSLRLLLRPTLRALARPVSPPERLPLL